MLAVPVASVTRLRLRSWRFLLPFLWYARRSAGQARAASGCTDVRLRRTTGLTFWTLTSWDSEDALRAFVAQAPHRDAMAKLTYWCDEAAFCRWVWTSPDRPSWDEAGARLRVDARLARLQHPSREHAAGRVNVE